MISKAIPKDIDAYIKTVDKEVKPKIVQMRELIRSAAPKAEETISYGMPAFKLDGPLVFFMAAKKHLGFYPTPSAIIAFADALTPYVTSKGAIQLPLDKPLPVKLIKDIVKFRVAENKEKAAKKAAKKK